MSTPAMLWFILRRSVFLGLKLGAGLGTAYGLTLGMAVGVVLPPLILIGSFQGVLFGALAGLPLGIVQGVTLCGVTLLLHPRSVSSGVDRYRKIAGRVCAAICVTALTLFFGLTVWNSGVSLMEVPSDWLEDDLPFLMIIVIGPSLVAAGAAWWAGRKVAGQLAQTVSKQKA